MINLFRITEDGGNLEGCRFIGQKQTCKGNCPKDTNLDLVDSLRLLLMTLKEEEKEMYTVIKQILRERERERERERGA